MNSNKIPFENETIFTSFGCAEFNKTQDNPLNLPAGFFEVQTAGGDKLGFGYYCPKCKLHVTHNAKAVKHCDKVEEIPTSFFARRKFFWNLKTVKIQRRWY